MHMPGACEEGVRFPRMGVRERGLWATLKVLGREAWILCENKYS